MNKKWGARLYYYLLILYRKKRKRERWVNWSVCLSPDSPCNFRNPCGCRCKRKLEYASACRAQRPRHKLPLSPSSYHPCSNLPCSTFSDHFGPGSRPSSHRIPVCWCTWNPRWIPLEIGLHIPIWTVVAESTHKHALNTRTHTSPLTRQLSIK